MIRKIIKGDKHVKDQKEIQMDKKDAQPKKYKNFFFLIF
jgi:hypothetical protein